MPSVSVVARRVLAILPLAIGLAAPVSIHVWPLSHTFPQNMGVIQRLTSEGKYEFATEECAPCGVDYYQVFKDQCPDAYAVSQCPVRAIP